jgi:hypothetical protein
MNMSKPNSSGWKPDADGSLSPDADAYDGPSICCELLADADAGFSWQDDEHGRQSCGLQERRLRYVWPWW